MTNLPPRTADTISEAIALSSPSGQMSKAARARADKRLSVALFGPGGLQHPQGPERDERAHLLHRASQLRALAERGMCKRKYRREAERLETEAANLPNE